MCPKKGRSYRIKEERRQKPRNKGIRNRYLLNHLILIDLGMGAGSLAMSPSDKAKLAHDLNRSKIKRFLLWVMGY